MMEHRRLFAGIFTFLLLTGFYHIKAQSEKILDGPYSGEAIST